METLVADGHRHACGSVLVVDDEPTIAEIVSPRTDRAPSSSSPRAGPTWSSWT